MARTSRGRCDVVVQVIEARAFENTRPSLERILYTAEPSLTSLTTAGLDWPRALVDVVGIPVQPTDAPPHLCGGSCRRSNKMPKVCGLKVLHGVVVQWICSKTAGLWTIQ